MLQAAMFDILVSGGRDENRTVMFGVVSSMPALRTETERHGHRIFESVFGSRPTDIEVTVENGNIRCKLQSVSQTKNYIYIHSFFLAKEELDSMTRTVEVLKGGGSDRRPIGRLWPRKR